jgi:hypothetical protein
MPLQGRLSIEHMCQLAAVSRKRFLPVVTTTGTARGRDGSAVIDSTDRSGTSSSLRLWYKAMRGEPAP